MQSICSTSTDSLSLSPLFYLLVSWLFSALSFGKFLRRFAAALASTFLNGKEIIIRIKEGWRGQDESFSYKKATKTVIRWCKLKGEGEWCWDVRVIVDIWYRELYLFVHHKYDKEHIRQIMYFLQILFDQEDNSKDVEGGLKESHDHGTLVGIGRSPLPPSATIVGVSTYHALFLLFLLSVWQFLYHSKKRDI